MSRAGKKMPGERPDVPTVAYISYMDAAGAGQINCTVVEDPDRDAFGYRVFWIEPERDLAPGETVQQVYLDVLPARSVAKVRWIT